MRKEVIIEIPFSKIVEMKSWGLMSFESRIEYLIENEVVLHNDQLGVDYVLKDFKVCENFAGNSYKCKLVIDILEDIKEIGNTSLIEHQIRSLV